MTARALKIMGIVSLLVGMAGCNTTPHPSYTSTPEESASVARVSECFERNIPKFDDGVTDPAKIAAAIAKGPCAREQAIAKKVYLRDIPPERLQAVSDAIDRVPIAAGKELILQRRKGG
ncbi:hypothetical protein [Pleomorphomonas oryzae]|uniref:hypothetical protein n=1 Tax=Pleomorphomonas oryzae TaxID=261934 RepID=UPI0012EB9B1A|nr:hypothetical protein [Pleomorphomonas oryzae]